MNFDSGHVMGFLIMACLSGSLLGWNMLTIRVVGWIALWQLFTPTQEWYVDIPMMIIGFTLSEGAYFFVTGRKR